MMFLGIILLSNLLQVVTDSEFVKQKNKCEFYLPKVPGWCSKDKASKMMDLIYQVKPTTCVEIGVFGGSSILPTGLALKYNKKGVVFAIDPWEHEPCLNGYNPEDANYKWWKSIDLEKIYQDFLLLVKQQNISEYVTPIRSTSKAILDKFSDESIDILHIDGNHSKEFALSDAYLYFPKVKKGGYIWFDDVNWESTSEAQGFLYENCEYIKSYSTDSFALFRK